MILFVKKFVFELLLYVIGFVVFTLMKTLGQATLRLGRAVFSR